jgi:hypothetical protein
MKQDEKDSEIERLKEELERYLKYNVFLEEARNNRDAEIERLKSIVTEHSCEAAELAWFKKDALKLITELADALENFKGYGVHLTREEADLIQRAREATK